MRSPDAPWLDPNILSPLLNLELGEGVAIMMPENSDPPIQGGGGC